MPDDTIKGTGRRANPRGGYQFRDLIRDPRTGKMREKDPNTSFVGPRKQKSTMRTMYDKLTDPYGGRKFDKERPEMIEIQKRKESKYED